MLFLALFLHSSPGVFLWYEGAICACVSDRAGTGCRDSSTKSSAAGSMSVAGRSTLSFSVYRPDPTVEEAIGFNINTSSPQWRGFLRKWSFWEDWMWDSSSQAYKSVQNSLPVWLIYFLFLLYSGSAALTHSSDSNLFSMMSISLLIWQKQSWDYLFNIYFLLCLSTLG